MSKVLDLDSNEVIDICADPDCNAEIFFGQAVWKKGHDLICSTGCLLRVLGAKTVIAGREGEVKPHEA